MKKSLFTRLIKPVAFLLVFVSVFCSLSVVLRFKYYDAFRQADAFYRQKKNTVDVLVLGSSHAYSDIHPAVFWEDYGYASFVFGASIQPLWNSYYYLVEALKYQTPKVVILEGYRLVEQNEYTGTAYAVKSTYGLRWSKNRIDALKASFREEDLPTYFFPFNNYHSRYSEVNRGDFVPHFDSDYFIDYKGELNNMNTYALEKPDVAKFNPAEKPLKEKTQEYYIKMLELAQERGFTLITAVAPYNINEKEYGYYKTAEKLAASYGMPFINANERYDEIGIDFSADFGDKVGHLNSTGAQKFTRYLASYISKNCAVPDRRGDSAYASWEENTEQFHRNYYNNGLTELTTLSETVDLCLDKGEYSFIMILNGADEANPVFCDLFGKMTGGSAPDTLPCGVYVIRNGKLTFSSSKQTLDKGLRMDAHNDIRLGFREISYLGYLKESSFYAVVNDNETTLAYPAGLALIVYDEIYDRVVETVYSDGTSDPLTRDNMYLEQKK